MIVVVVLLIGVSRHFERKIESEGITNLMIIHSLCRTESEGDATPI